LLTPEQVLSSRPVRNPELKIEPTEKGGLKVYLKRSTAWWVWVLAVLFPIPRERMVELDEVGKQVWELCDGKNTLQDMIEIFRREHKLTRAEAEWSLRTYLRDLGKRGMVAFLVEERGRGRREGEPQDAGPSAGKGKRRKKGE